MGTPIKGEPVPNTGMLLYELEDMKARATAAHRAGLLVMIEGVGDRGIDFALDAIEAALEVASDGRPPDAGRALLLRHPADPEAHQGAGRGRPHQPPLCTSWETPTSPTGGGGDGLMWPHRALIDASIPAPATRRHGCSANPWTALGDEPAHDLGQSLNPSQAITVEEALRAYTTLGAYSGERRPTRAL